MKNSFKKFKKGPLIASLIFLLVVIFVFVLLHKKIQSNNQESSVKEAEIQTETSRKNEVKALKQLLGEIGEEKTSLDTHFIKSSDVAVFLDALENLAPRVNVKAEVTLVDVAADNTSLTVGMTAKGSFEALYKFITLLENSSYQLEFVSMQMNRIGVVEETNAEGESVPGAGGVVQWSANFKVKLLSFLP
jgi:Tfp pilus assembly protein PilN